MGIYSLIGYTRKELEDAIYSKKLAYSMHLALKKDESITILNHNSGILYAKATSNEDGTLNAKSLTDPWIKKISDDMFCIIARRIEPEGTPDISSEGQLLYFETTDFIYYSEEILIEENSELGKQYQNYLQNKQAVSIDNIPDSVIGNIIEISEDMAIRLIHRFTTPINVGNDVPTSVKVSSKDELNEIKAVARYSDGSMVEKKVDWYTDNIDWKTHGRYKIEGKIHQDKYEFPIAINRADPCVGRWNGKYYFIATNDADWNNTLYIREADSLPGLVTAQEVLLLDTKTYPHLGGLLWAPEFHIIKNKLYIFHAATPKEFHDEQSHVMALKAGGNPMKACDWEVSRRVVKKDGSPLITGGITLDMTEFEVDGRYYVCWSQRQFEPVDQGAWLYFAEIDPDEPWKLISDPVLLSKPEWGWANNHTFVDEGPFVLFNNKKIYMTFSSAAVDSTYVVGMLSADIDSNLLDPKSWTKENYPLLSSRSVEGEFGTGHNAYVVDDDGLIWNTYHARPSVDAPRSSGIRRLHFNIEGFPVLDMTEDKDLSFEHIWVETIVEL